MDSLIKKLTALILALMMTLTAAAGAVLAEAGTAVHTFTDGIYTIYNNWTETDSTVHLCVHKGASRQVHHFPGEAGRNTIKSKKSPGAGKRPVIFLPLKKNYSPLVSSAAGASPASESTLTR